MWALGSEYPNRSCRPVCFFFCSKTDPFCLSPCSVGTKYIFSLFVLFLLPCPTSFSHISGFTPASLHLSVKVHPPHLGPCSSPRALVRMSVFPPNRRQAMGICLKNCSSKNSCSLGSFHVRDFLHSVLRLFMLGHLQGLAYRSTGCELLGLLPHCLTADGVKAREMLFETLGGLWFSPGLQYISYARNLQGVQVQYLT